MNTKGDGWDRYFADQFSMYWLTMPSFFKTLNDVKLMRTLWPIYSSCRAKKDITYLENMTPFYALHTINYTHNYMVCI